MTKAQIKKEIVRIYAENIAYKYLPMPYQTGMKIFKEEVVNFISSKFSVRRSLPDIYSGKLNTKRIKKYKKLAEEYNISEGSIRDIFCKGADWYKEVTEGNDA